jgi:GT2 family glycosyltransferase/SAM-dependent methyltransferase/predicted Zn-dependent protease
MHQSSFNITTCFRELVDRAFPQEAINVLDVGSYGVNGTYREIFSDSGKYLYTGLDVNPGPNVDYVPSDPYDWPDLQDESFDVIISGQAFEHIEYPWLIIEEMSRVLKKNGLICIVAPSRGPEHKYPVDCWRYYPDGFRALAKWANLEVLDAKTTWGKSGFTDGSDQWGDTFCILYKPENQDKTLRREKKAKSASRSFNINNPLKQNKQASYYGFARPDVVEAIIKNNLPTSKVLEIGCAGGATGKNMKERLPVQSYLGIDISPEAADMAKNHLDRVIVADVENSDLSSEHGLKPDEYDLLLALDVLEHLYDPWDSLAELSRYVKPGGYVVASIPNIQNITIVQDLIKGNWHYQDAGILDATHLRFFTLEEAKKMFSGADLSVQSIEQVMNPALDMTKVKESGNTYRQGKLVINDLSRTELIQFFTYQYIIIAKKASAPATAKVQLPEKISADESIGQNQPLSRFRYGESLQGVVSIVILTFNQLEYTKKCVKSIRKYTPEHHEIIFVDNGSTDGTVKWLTGQIQEKNNYHLIENRENFGFAKGCNQGMEASRGEFILLLNNDVVVADGWLSGLLDCLNHAPEAGIVGPMTNNISGPQQAVSDEYRSMDYLERYAAKYREQYRHRRIPLRRIVGFCMLFKRTLTEQIGMLDESFGTGNFEDDDFCLRAVLAGYRNYVAGDVFIHHFGSRSFIGNKIDYGTSISSNRKIIEQKWTLSTQTTEGRRLAVLNATELANDLYQKGKMDQAIEALIDCIKIAPNAQEIYDELTLIFIETRRFAEALEVIESMPGEVRESLNGLQYAGYIKEGLGLDEEAAGYTGRMLALDEKYAPALNLRGVLAYKRGEKEQAAEYFKKAIDADPGYGEGWINLGIIKWSTDRKDEAIKDLKRGVILAPLVPDHSSIYYSAISSMEQFTEAEAVFRDVRRFYPNSKNIVFLLIDILIRQGKWKAAMLEIEDAMVAFNLDEGMLNAALAVREHLGPLLIDKAHAKKSTLSLCMIVKNEEKNLARCLKSVRGVVDEMIVVDTGSTDKTMDIARAFGARIYEFPWTGDFSAARNLSLEKATGDWIFVLDADEVISARDFDELRSLIRKGSSSPAAYSIFTRNYTRNMGVIGWSPNSGQCPEEAGAGWATSAKVRLFTRRKDVFFSNPVHEMVEDSLRKAKIPFHPCKMVVHHYGKLDLIRDSQKGEDYYLLGKMKYESDPTNVKFINELAKQAQVLNKYEEAVELWQKLISLVDPDPESLSYKEIARISYGNPLSEMYIQMASAQLMLDRYEEALMAARKAMETKIRRVEYVHVYAHCEIIAGSLEKAFSALEELLETTPEYPPALFMMAVIYCLEMKREKAHELFQSLLRRGVQMTPLLNKTAKQFHGLGKRDEALRILNATVENRIGDEETTSLRDALLGSQGSA